MWHIFSKPENPIQERGTVFLGERGAGWIGLKTAPAKFHRPEFRPGPELLSTMLDHTGVKP